MKVGCRDADVELVAEYTGSVRNSVTSAFQTPQLQSSDFISSRAPLSITPSSLQQFIGYI